jgi:putative Ca2+/H+ antiporter (TMEM165/GDT1 family)
MILFIVLLLTSPFWVPILLILGLFTIVFLVKVFPVFIGLILMLLFPDARPLIVIISVVYIWYAFFRNPNKTDD